MPSKQDEARDDQRETEEELDHTELFRQGPRPPWERSKNTGRSWLSK